MRARRRYASAFSQPPSPPSWSAVIRAPARSRSPRVRRSRSAELPQLRCITYTVAVLCSGYLTSRRCGRCLADRSESGGDAFSETTIPNASSSICLGWILSSRATSLFIRPSVLNESNTFRSTCEVSRSAGSGSFGDHTQFPEPIEKRCDRHDPFLLVGNQLGDGGYATKPLLSLALTRSAWRRWWVRRWD